MSDYRFKVDLKGIIRLLSDNLYSDDSVFLRELLQNAIDALSARQLTDESFENPCIKVHYTKENSKATVVFSDNGIGLTRHEVHEFLSIIGKSSKRDAQARNTFIGQFGIGLLSCFLVTDTIEVHTRPAQSECSYTWLGKSDGTYDILEDNLLKEQGTEVKLTLTGAMFQKYDEDEIEETLEKYGYMLKIPVVLCYDGREECVNDNFIPWHEKIYTAAQVLDFGEDVFERSFLDAIPLTGEDMDGYAFVSNTPGSSNANDMHKIYLKDMFITENGVELIPKWAFFVQCVINAQNLTPTASREGFYRDNKLLKAKAQIERSIIEYLSTLAQYDSKKLLAITQIHNVAIKSLAMENDKVYQLFFPFLSFPSNKGALTGGQILQLAKHQTVHYCTDLDTYRKMCPIMESNNRLLVNGGYIYDSSLLSKLSKFHKNIAVKPMEDSALSGVLQDVKQEEARNFAYFLSEANAVLRRFSCMVEVKRFLPEELSSLFVPNEMALLMNDISGASQEHELSFFSTDLEEEYLDINLSHLYLNLDNSLVKSLTKLEAPSLIETIAEVLYIQALLMGHHPINNKEMKLLSKNLIKLLELGIG